MGQLTIASSAILLFVLVGRAYIKSVSDQVKDVREASAAELARLTASWESRLTDQRDQAVAWRDTAIKAQQTNAELSDQVTSLLRITNTTEAIVRAIREGQRDR
jgi:hypothetical protein